MVEKIELNPQEVILENLDEADDDDFLVNSIDEKLSKRNAVADEEIILKPGAFNPEKKIASILEKRKK